MHNVRRAAVLTLAALALPLVAACDEGYKTVDVRPESDSVHQVFPGDTVRMIAVLLQNEVFFPFASSLHELYDSRIRPSAFRWSSADTAVATVDETGLVRARRAGSTAIRARAEGITGAFPLRVDEPAP